MQAAAVAEEVLEKEPNHPGALHYLIHCCDDPIHAPLGLRAARRCAKVAPESSHAQHMPSHIFFALGMWDEAVASNAGAWNLSRGKPSAGGFHALWWLAYAYLQQGKYADARSAVQTMERLAAGPSPPLLRFHLVQMRAMYSIETGEAYQAGANTSDLDLPAAGADLFAKAISALNNGRRNQADAARTAIRDLQRSTTSRSAHHHHGLSGGYSSCPGNGEGSHRPDANGGREEQGSGRAYESRGIDRDKLAFEFGPPAPPKPAHELFGEMLLQLNEPDLAGAQFQLSLLRTPKRALSLLGLAKSFAQSGNKASARETYNELSKVWSQADPAIVKALDSSVAER